MKVWEKLTDMVPVYMTLYNRDGSPFSGSHDEYDSMHGTNLETFINRYDNIVIVVNEYGEVAARGHIDYEQLVSMYPLESMTSFHNRTTKQAWVDAMLSRSPRIER